MTHNDTDQLPEKPLDEGADECNEPAKGASFPIVGVGASAGGLEAFTQLLKAMPCDTGMAFVLVQHLSPTHASVLAEILARATSMPVMEVHNGTLVEPNHVYVIPPGQSMVISRGALQLLPREARGELRAIDQFFRALAEEQGHQAIGVVLSGTASDGTIGLEAIKAEGGITFAQDATAQHDGMPHSAIASGCVDFVLSPNAIARELVRIGKHPYAVPVTGLQEPDSEPDFALIVQLLHHACDVDFSHYKFNTLYRRVTRRMVLLKIEGVSQYVQFLRETPAEVEALYQDILINVTSFFRDPESYEALKSNVFPRLLTDRARNDPVRVWTLGCSTGQEAYSLAMAFTESAEALGSSAQLQLFATDLNAAAIEKARAGVYSKDIAHDVSPERLRRFFVEVDGSYRISKSIRDACVFSRHNVLSDPPFSRIDLISCRNLLIYLQPVLQQIIVPAMHYALKPAGFLWLGGSETIGGYRNLFEPEDVKHKIYAKKPGSTLGPGQFPLPHGGAPRSPFAPVAVRSSSGAAGLPREADRILLTKFAPPSVLVSADLEILQYRGNTGPYLTPAPGKASLSLLKMLREGLLVAVRAAILRAGKEQAPVREEGLQVTLSGGHREVAVEVIPLVGNGGNESGFLILFEEAGLPSAEDQSPENSQNRRPDAPCSPRPTPALEPDNARLEQELTATRDYLQSVIEEQEAANEELQSANEEAQSANEELQSVNEELETSKEEIQSSNEELATVNDELNNRNIEMTRVNNDLANLLDSVQMAIVILGPDLRVRRFTPAAEKLLNLTPTDVGRLLHDIKLKIDFPDLEPLLAEVFGTVSIRECDVRDRQGRWYSLRLRPYKTTDNKIDGVVVMLVDVDAIKRAHAFTASIVATVREPLLVLDKDLRVQTASRSFYERFRVTPGETENRFLYELGRGQWDLPNLRRLLEEIPPRDTQVKDFEVEYEFEDIGKKLLLLSARRLVQEGDRSPSIFLAIEDVTERKNLDMAIRRHASDLIAADHRKDEFLAMLAHELRNPLAPLRNALQLLKTSGLDAATSALARDMMERQLQDMTRLIDDLLDVSRITHGKVLLRKEPVELARILNWVVESVGHLFRDREQELAVSLPPEPDYVEADPTRLAQVFGNLLNNASKYNHRGGHVWLTAERVGGVGNDPGAAVIRLRDDGIGIPPDQLPRIFDMFAQVQQAVEQLPGGLGIGLTLVKSLVEMHGGTVEAQSAGAGQGSEFVVRLPVLVGSLQPAVPEEPTGREQAGTPRRRILIVDDNTDSAESLAMLLGIAGHEVHTAYDGEEGVEEAGKFRPEVILLDIGMPKLNGYHACRRIREQPWGKEMVVVALTGWGQDEDRRKTHDAGFDHHLVKPVDAHVLQGLLTRLNAAT